MADMIAALSDGVPAEQVMPRLQAMERVLLKVGEAIRLAPPILPGDDDEDDEFDGSDGDELGQVRTQHANPRCVANLRAYTFNASEMCVRSVLMWQPILE